MVAMPSPGSSDRSYRALLAVPTLGRVVVSMQLARVAQAMVGVAVVLFSLAEYDSPALAGIVTFAFLFPGILLSPVAGALLDRHGRVRLIVLDYVVAMVTMALIGILSLADALPPPLLVGIAAVSSLTGPLSQTGLRSLFPLMVPAHLWERVNALDSTGWVVATILGPPIAALMVAVLGPQVAILAIAIPFGLAALALIGVVEPPSVVVTSGSLLRDAWDGVRYAWRNPTIRGLGFSISTLNLTGGTVAIVVPLLIVERLHGSEALVGVAFALAGVAGMASVILAGRIDSRRREWLLLVVPMVATAPVTALLLVANADAVVADPPLAFGILVGSMMIAGLFTGPMDIGLFTIRQRRTHPEMIGRAFAVSMAFNFLGYPVGAAVAGAIADTSLDAAILLGVVACLVAAGLAAAMVPRLDEGEEVRAGHGPGEPGVTPRAGQAPQA
jgi:MFS family permease